MLKQSGCTTHSGPLLAAVHETLTLRRLAVLARAALALYDSPAARLELVHYRSNAVYRVTRPQGTRFALRIHAPETPKRHVRSELAWLDALHAGGLPVPRSMPAADGAPLVTVAAPEVSGRRICTLLTWIEGRHASRTRCTPGQVCHIVAAIARLHRHAARFGAPQGFTRPRWDPDLLLAHPGRGRLSAPQIRLMREVAGRFRRADAVLGHGREVFGPIHGDFTFENLLFHESEVRIIDFDDCGRGYYLYDLATLLDRMEWRPDYPGLRTALLAGYRKERALPPEHEALLDLFLLVRWTFLGLAFLSAPEHSPGRNYAPRFLQIVVPKMRKYLRAL